MRRPSRHACPMLIVCTALVVCAVLALQTPALAAKAKSKAKPKVAPAAAPTAAGGAALTPATFKVERHTLKNGIVVLTHEDHSVPAVTFWQWFKVGSRNEAPGITGISHFFEHMMFNGSKNVPPKEYDRIIESAGGVANAFTDRDMTAYYEDIAAGELEVLFRLDADRMMELLLDPQVMKSEIEVVKEERRLRTDNSIPGMLDEQLWSTAFNASPYGWPVVGWMGDLERINRDDCVKYFRTYYAPNNCIFVLTGDFDTAKTMALIEKYFGSIPSQASPPAPVNSEPDQRGERRVMVHYPAETVSLQMGYKCPEAKSKDIPVVEVLSSLLSEGESSRLHQALVLDHPIALDVGTFFQPRLDGGLFEIFLELKPGRTAAEGESTVVITLDRLIREGPAERELQKAKNLIEAEFVKSLKTNNGAGQQLAFHEHIHGDYRAMFSAVDRVRTVTATDVRRVAAELFDLRRLTVAVLVPDAREPAAGATP